MSLPSDSLNSLKRGGHALVVYESDATRDSIIFQFIKSRIDKKNCVRLISPDAKKRNEQLKKVSPFNLPIKNSSLIVDDIADIFFNEEPHLQLQKKIREMERLVDGKKYRGWSIIGEWIHAYYDRYEEMLLTEETFGIRKNSGSIVCCYRTEGLCGLDTKVLSKLIELHDYIVFPRETFVRNTS